MGHCNKFNCGGIVWGELGTSRAIIFKNSKGQYGGNNRMMETCSVSIEQWTDIRELALMCIGTDKGAWWADPSFGNELWKLRQEGKVDNKTAGKVQQMILDCLIWMKDDGLASVIECQAEQAGKNEIAYIVTIMRPNENPVIVKDVWYAVK
jgi:phage gp46-like protein